MLLHTQTATRLLIIFHQLETKHHQACHSHVAVYLLLLSASLFSSGPVPVVTQHVSPCFHSHAVRPSLASIDRLRRGWKIDRRAHRSCARFSIRKCLVQNLVKYFERFIILKYYYNESNPYFSY